MLSLVADIINANPKHQTDIHMLINNQILLISIFVPLVKTKNPNIKLTNDDKIQTSLK